MKMARIRATEDHPISIKLEKLFDFMVSLGLEIRIDRYGNCIVNDIVVDNIEWELCYMEGDSVFCFPPAMEYKLIREREE
jgi:hypothetical protein